MTRAEMGAMPLRPVHRPHRDDWLVAAAGLAGGLLLWGLDLYNTPALVPGHRWLTLLPLAVMCVAVLGRRVAQPWALLLAIPTMVADSVMGTLLATLLMFTDVVYAAVLYGSARLARTVLPGAMIFTVAATVTAVAVFREPQALLLGAIAAGITVAPASTGALVRTHKNEAAAERLRAEQTALLAEMDRTQAINAERSRMARELHDVVANHLSAIAIHSTAALSLQDAGTTTRDALGVIRENSVQGLAEMRRLIGLLRDAEGAEESPATPSLDGIEALLDRARAASEGLEFTLRDERERDGDGTPTPVPAPVELAAYRVVQEAVTNALKHASPGAVTLRLARTDDGGALAIRVTSPLSGHDDVPRAPGSGAGLIGMRERVELLRGELTTGPATADDGAKIWEVRAVLPVREQDEGKERNR
ncbi:sensor histidine kinase [Streptomyces sp. NPDC048172]|uniref:sensor histidine kinase n=1 Tax=Streptomyces sp. NPDC048172 TaxID=3365505 RepID=UPI00371839AD